MFVCETISRADAAASGSKRYFSGEPCRFGHIAQRYVKRNQCVVCCAENKERWAKKYPDRALNWNLNHPERMKEINNRFYANNKEKRKNNVRRCRLNKTEYYRERRAAYRKAHHAEILAACRNRKAKLKNAGGRHSAQDVRELLVLQKHQCVYCRTSLKPGYHVDHIIPLNLGGRNDRTNLQITCARCNLRKNAKHPIEFAREIGMLV